VDEDRKCRNADRKEVPGKNIRRLEQVCRTKETKLESPVARGQLQQVLGTGGRMSLKPRTTFAKRLGSREKIESEKGKSGMKNGWGMGKGKEPVPNSLEVK